MRPYKLPQNLALSFYGSWQDSWKPTESDAHGRSGAFMSSAFPYDAERDLYLCPAGQQLPHKQILDRGNGVRTHVYKAAKAACASCHFRTQCASKQPHPKWRRSITRMEDSPEAIAFKAKMQSEAGKKIYSQRSQIAEFPHAWIKERCGLRQFRCQGKEKANMEATWVCLSYNLIRLFSTRRKLASATAAAA